MSKTKPRLLLNAEAITVVETTPGECAISVFGATADTRTKIAALGVGDRFDGVELIDRWDDGEDDCHINHRIHVVTEVITAWRKPNCIIIKMRKD